MSRVFHHVYACAFALALIGCAFEHGEVVQPDAAPASITIAFGSAGTEVDEASRSVMIAVTLSGVSSGTVTVDYSVGAATATRPDDYALTDGRLTFLPGQTEQTIVVEIEMDAVEEPDETVAVQLTAPVGATLGSTVSHTITISSDILPRASFMTAMPSVANEATNEMVEVRLSAAPKQSVSVELGVTGTATAADRAVSDGQAVTFAPGVTSQLVPLGVVQDALDEDDETVVLALKNPSPKLLLATTNLTRMHTITDDDPLPTVGFAAATSMTNENQAATLTVQLSTASGRMVSVPYSVTGGTAGGSDVTIAPASVVFMPGQTSRTITVGVTNDALDEPNETLTVTLAAPVNATLATTAHTLTINDDDNPPQAAFTQAATSVNEAMTAVTFTVQLSSASSFDISVPFALGAATTADNPEDFTLASSAALAIPAGMTSATVMVNVKADTLDEANETVVLTLGTPTNATVGAVASETLTITDDDASPTVSFTSTGANPNEGNSNITLTVQLSDISGQDVTVPFTIDAASTASDPTDYTIAPASSVVIAAGETSSTITIAMKEDVLDEPDETVIVALATPTNATLAAPSTYTLTIKNDDQP